MKTKTQFTNRILSLVLSIMMVVSMLPASALSVFAAEGDVASVTTTEGTQTYADLTSAFAAAEQAENSVLTLLADTTISSTVYVYGGKFTVDLNGKTWTANCRALGILGADMRITDSTADGLGKIVGTTGNSTIMIGNGTKLEVAGGTVENTRDGRCIDTQYNGHTSDAQFTLSGGKLITAGWSAIHVDCTSVTIKNGEIKSQGDAYYHGDDHDYRSGLLDFSQHPDPTGIAVINYAGVEIIPGDTTIKLPAGYCFYEQDANQPVTALPADMTNGYIIGKAPVCTCEEKCSTYTDNGDGTHDKVCGECGYVEVDNEAHTGGTATCTTLAVCEACGASYGELGTHTAEPTYAINAEDSTKHDATYSCCGATVTEAHNYKSGTPAGACVCGAACLHSSFDSTTGICGDCQASVAIAKIETGETTTYYQTADELRTAVDLSGDDQTLTLLADLAIKDTFFFNANGTKNTLDLNGHTLICSDPISERILLGDCELAITGTGSINIFMGADDEGAKIVVGSGVTLNNSLRSAYGGVLDLTNATIPEAGLNVILYSDYWDPTTYNVSDVLLLPADYYFFMDGKAVYTYSGETEGTVLKHTDHSYTYTDNGDGTHDATCSVCGKMVDNEAHIGGEATCTEKAECQHCGASYGEVDTTNHDYDNYICTICGNPVAQITGTAVNDDFSVTFFVEHDKNYLPWDALQFVVYNGDQIIPLNINYDGVERPYATMTGLNPDCKGITLTAEIVIHNYHTDHEKTIATVEVKNPDNHSPTYSASGNAISASCSKCNADFGTATITAENTTYNGTAQETATVTYSGGWTGGDLTVSYANNTNAGTATASITVGEVTASIDFTIAKATVIVTANAKTKTYGEADPELTYTVNGLFGEDKLTGALSRTEGENAGKYAITQGTLTAGDNYTISFTGAEFTIIDKTAPTGEILIKNNGWKQFWNWISFGLFCKDNVDVTVTADGTGSGVAKVEYLLSDTALDENNIPTEGWTEISNNNGKYSFSIQPQNKVAVYVRITDEGGNETVINSDGIVVYEDSKAIDTEVHTTYRSTQDVTVKVELNGNTIEDVKFGTQSFITDGYCTVNGDTITLDGSKLYSLGARSYEITVYYNPMGVENSGVTDLTTTFILVIDKVDGKVSNINISGKTYDGTAVTAPTYDKLGNGVVTVEYKVKGADDSTYTTAAPKNAGDYVVRVTAAEGTNHKAASATAEFSITPASIENAEVTLDPNTVVYNGSEHKPAVTVTWNGITLTENTDYVVYYRNNVNASDATVLGIVYVVGTNNFEGSIEKEFEITYAQLTEVEVKQQGTLTYNGQEQTPVVSVNAKSVDGCPVTFTYRTSPHDTYGTMPGFTGAGTYTVYFKASAQNHNDYYGSFDVTIAKKAVTVTANDASKTYGDSDPALTYTHTELIGSDALDITVSRASGENANTYTITASQAEDANPNYEITFKTGTFTIHKAALTVTAEDKTATYGDAVPNYTVKYEGFKNGDDKDDLGGALAFECDYAQFSDKGEYTVKASGYTSGNYTISYVDGKLTVNAKPITVTIQNATSVYGDTLAELKATDNGIVNGDANVYSLATTATGTSNVGKYAITGTALDSNYDVTFVNGEYEITKREITITVDAKNTVVNTTLPTYTYKVEGLVGVDALVTEPTLTCNANIAVIGEYDITASGADAGDNYSIKYVPAKLTVLTDNAVDAAAGYTEELKDYDPATVTSEDKAELEEMLSEIETILDNENITDNGKKALEEVKEQVEKLIKEITDAAEATDTENTVKVENVTPENVTPENKTDLEGAKADLEKALEDNGGNYTEDEKKAIEDEIKRIDDALEVIGNVEAVEELIDKLPENITKNDEDAIKAADDAYNALSDYEKSLVDEAAKKALTDAKAALAELNKPADPNSPATGDNSNMFLWIALLFISGGAVITLTVVDRKKRAVAKK